MKNIIINYFKNFKWKSFGQLNIGILLCAISATFFISPSGIVAGGTTGLSVLLQSITNVPYYIYMYAFNIFLIIIGFFLVGKEFTLKTIYGSIIYPTYSALLSLIIGLTNLDISTYLEGVEAIFVVGIASVIMGTGVGLAIKSGGSSGGFDILEAIFLKYFHIPYSVSMYILDAVLVVSGGIFFNAANSVVFDNGLAEAFGAVLYIFIDGLMIDMVSFGSFNKRAIFITSTKYEEISDYIVYKMARGLTYLDSMGAYKKENGKMLVCVCHSREYFLLRDAINKIDPNAFIFVSKATEVRGLGYTYETKEYLQSRKNIKK